MQFDIHHAEELIHHKIVHVQAMHISCVDVLHAISMHNGIQQPESIFGMQMREQQANQQAHALRVADLGVVECIRVQNTANCVARRSTHAIKWLTYWEALMEILLNQYRKLVFVGLSL